MVEGATTAELRMDEQPPDDSCQQLIYGALVTLLMLMRDLGEAAFCPISVSIGYDRRGRDVNALETALGCCVFAGQARSSISFDKSLLGRPISSANQSTFRLIHDLPERLRMEQGRSFLQRVDDAICGTLHHGGTPVRCAAALGLTPRALQFALDSHGVSFSDLLSRRRMGLAQTYLLTSNPYLSIDDIAVRLSYAEQTSFGRAFKRWTGVTPGAFRKSGRRRHQ